MTFLLLFSIPLKPPFYSISISCSLFKDFRLKWDQVAITYCVQLISLTMTTWQCGYRSSGIQEISGYAYYHFIIVIIQGAETEPPSTDLFPKFLQSGNYFSTFVFPLSYLPSVFQEIDKCYLGDKLNLLNIMFVFCKCHINYSVSYQIGKKCKSRFILSSVSLWFRVYDWQFSSMRKNIYQNFKK